MTTIAAPSRRARSTSRATVTRAPSSARARGAAPARAKAPAQTKARAAAHPLSVGKVGALLAVLTVFALVTAVVFHVFLAQHQLELDHLNAQISKEQRVYEQRRLTASQLASPQRVIQEAQRLGLELPAAPPQYLRVEGAPPLPKSADGSTADTLADWQKTKASLDPQQP